MQKVLGTSTIEVESLVRYIKASLGLGFTPKLEKVIRAAYKYEAELGIRADIVTLQMMKETGWGASELFLKFNNFAGVGVTGTVSTNPATKKPDPVEGTDWQLLSDGKWHQGLASADEDKGVGQVFGHHLGYLYTSYIQRGHDLDARYDLLFKVRAGKPACVNISDYSNQWAQTWVNGKQIPNTYGEDIEKMFNEALVWVLAHPVATAAATPEPTVIFVEETKRSLGNAFLNFWRSLEKVGDSFRLIILGWPKTNEFDFVIDGVKHTVQLFERGGLIFDGTKQEPWKVTVMTIPQLLQAYNYAIQNHLYEADATTNILTNLNNRLFNYGVWCEVLENTFVSFAKLGLTTERLSMLDHMIKAMREGQTYEQWSSGQSKG